MTSMDMRPYCVSSPYWLGPFVTHVGATALTGFMFQCQDNMYQHSRGNQFESRSHYGLPPSFSSIYYASLIIIQLTYETGGACSTGRDSKCIQNIGWKTQENTLERDTRKWKDNNWDLQRLVRKGVEWIYLANDKVNWKALVKRVVKLRPA